MPGPVVNAFINLQPGNFIPGFLFLHLFPEITAAFLFKRPYIVAHLNVQIMLIFAQTLVQ